MTKYHVKNDDGYVVDVEAAGAEVTPSGKLRLYGIVNETIALFNSYAWASCVQTT